MFDLLRKTNPGFRNQIEPIVGDLSLPSLGISQEDETKLINSVSVVFHSAATLRFDEPLKYEYLYAYYINTYLDFLIELRVKNCSENEYSWDEKSD